MRRYLYVDEWRLVLVEPSTTQPGQGTVRFLADLNYVLACPETHNTRALQLVIRQPVYRPMARTALDHREHHVIFSGRLVFDNHIRCVAAQQYLERGRGEWHVGGVACGVGSSLWMCRVPVSVSV